MKCDIICKHDLCAPVAQLVEHLTFNQGVRSSILRRSTKKAGIPSRYSCFFYVSCQNGSVVCRANEEGATLRHGFAVRNISLPKSILFPCRKFSAEYPRGILAFFMFLARTASSFAEQTHLSYYLLYILIYI